MRASFFQSVRFPVSVGTLVLGWFLSGAAQGVWNRYWLLQDRQQTVAAVTKEHGHSVVDYTYRVAGKEYRGTSRRRYLDQEHKYEEAVVGGTAVVYFSASHPWLSNLTPPSTIIPEGFPVMVLILAFEVQFVITLINPDSRWAYKLPQRRAAS